MKITKTELVRKLNKIKGIVPKVTTMPVLQGVLVKDGYLIANNMETAVKAKLEGTEGECFLIPQKAFDLINNLPAEEIEITSGGAGNVVIRTGSIKNTYKTLDPEMFPVNKDSYDDSGKFELESEDLLNALRHVVWATANEKISSVMSSVCLKAHAGRLNFTALNKCVVAWDRLDCPGEFEILIPKNSVDKILSVGLKGKVSIRYSKSNAVFATDAFEVHTRLIEGEFYNFNSLFGTSLIVTSISRAELLDAMIRTKLCTAEMTPNRFEFYGDSLTVRLQDSSTDYTETLTIEKEISEKFLIGFDSRLVVDALKAFDSQTVNLGLKNSKSPMVIEADGSSLKTLVLPVLLRG